MSITIILFKFSKNILLLFIKTTAPQTLLVEANDKFRRMIRLAVAVPVLQVAAVVVLVPMLIPDALPPWDAFLARYFPSLADRGKKKQPFVKIFQQ